MNDGSSSLVERQVNRHKHCGVFAAAAICLQSVLLMHLAWRDAPAYDEVGHLPAGLSHCDFGSFDLYNASPPLVRIVAALAVYPARPRRDWKQFVRLPGARTEILVGRDFVKANGRRSFRLFTFARWACIPFVLLGGYVCFLWAKELYGSQAGLMTLALWTFAPNILANGHLITPDIGATSLVAISGYCFWRWLKRPIFSAALLCGFLLGLTQLTRITGLVLCALWPAIWVFWRLTSQKFDGSSRSDSDRFRNPKSEARQLAAMFLVAAFVLNLGYGFEGSFKKLGDYRFVSEALSGERGLRTGAWGNRFSGTLLGEIPVPVPENYLLGIDIPKESFEPKEPKYLLGEFERGRQWYYYLYALTVKVPLGTLLLFLLTWLSAIERRPSNQERQTTWRDEVVLLAPAVGIFLIVSANPWMNRQVPDVLPAFPFGFFRRIRG